jgi:hypothetical protein
MSEAHGKGGSHFHTAKKIVHKIGVASYRKAREE